MSAARTAAVGRNAASFGSWPGSASPAELLRLGSGLFVLRRGGSLHHVDQVEAANHVEACWNRHAARPCCARPDAQNLGTEGEYAVKCDDCRAEIGYTFDQGRSAAGGRCVDCQRAVHGQREDALLDAARQVLDHARAQAANRQLDAGEILEIAADLLGGAES